MTADDDRLADLVADFQDRLDGTPQTGETAVPPELAERYAQAQDLMQQLASLRTTPAFADPDPSPLRRIGRFHVIRPLGEGGYGVVFLAHDPQLRRSIALKVPRPDVMLDPGLRGRFVREARLAAKISHPNTVPVFEAGDDGPLCYLAAAYVDGPSLAQWLKANPGPCAIDLTARAMWAVANGLAAIHAEHVLHRDLKPQNILLDTTDDNWPAGFGRPRICDFGLARDASAAASTTAGVVLGTLEYMATEQARGEPVDARADIYACGVILFQMLAGRLPFTAEAPPALLHKLLHDETPSLRPLRPHLPAELDAIVAKCLEKDPAKRYAAAADLRDDLDRFLRYEPTLARPRTRLQRWSRAVRRQQVSIAISLLIGFGIVAAMFAWHAVSEHRAIQRQQEQADEDQRQLNESARQRQAEADTAARIFRSAKDDGVTHGLLAAVNEDLATLPERFQSGFVARYLRHGPAWATHVSDEWALGSVWPAPDGSYFVTQREGDWWGAMRLPQSGGRFDVYQRQPWDHIRQLPALASMPLAIPGGFAAITCSGRRLDYQTATRTFTMDPPLIAEHEEVVTAQLDAKGSVLVVRDRRNGSHTIVTDRRTPFAMPMDVTNMALNRDRSRGVMVIAYKTVTAFDLSTGTSLWSVDADCKNIALSANAKYVALGGGVKSTTRVVKMSDGSTAFETMASESQSIPAFSPDERYLLTVAHEPEHEHARTAVLWDIARERVHTRLGAWLPPTGRGRSPAFSADGASIFLPRNKDGLFEWRIGPRSARTALSGHGRAVWGLAVDPAGNEVATAADDSSCVRWNLASGEPLPGKIIAHLRLVDAVSYSPDGRFVATGGHDQCLKLWDRAALDRNESLSPLWSVEADTRRAVRTLAWNPDGRIIATGGYDNLVRLWNTRDGSLRGAIDPAPNQPLPKNTWRTVRQVAWNPAGRLLAVAGERELLSVLDADGKVVRTIPSPVGRIHSSVAWSDNDHFFVGGEDGSVTCYRTDGTTIWVRNHSGSATVRAVAASPCGTIATAGESGTINLWDARTGTVLLTLEGHAAPIWALDFDPHGTILASADSSGAVRIWRAKP